MSRRAYYPHLGNPLHEVRDWSKVRRMIRALRAGEQMPAVYIDGEPGNCNMISGTHRAAASEIRAQLDGLAPYDDLEVVDVSEIFAAHPDLIETWEGDPEAATDAIDRIITATH